MIMDLLDTIHPDQRNYKPREMNPNVLAYIGDGVYELFIRSWVIQTGLCKVNELHKLTVDYVKAGSQAKALKVIQDELLEDEASIVRRARNNKSLSVPKNASIMEYRMATGFEALLGYLYLSNNNERLEYFIHKAISILNEVE